MEEEQCIAGCRAYTGGEIHHHKHCPFYPDSMSMMYDNLKAENEIYKTQIQSMIKEENYMIDNANEIISLSDNYEHCRDILKYRRDIGISNRIIRSLKDIQGRIIHSNMSLILIEP